MIKKGSLFFTLFLVFPFMFSCIGGANIKSSVQNFDNEKIAVADALFMHEVFGITDPVERFNKNLFVGSIQFSGGFIRNPEMGMMVQSKHMQLSETGLFEKNAKGFVSELMKTVFDKRKIESSAAGSGSVLKLITFSDETDRVKYPEDERDNISLPRQKRAPVIVDKKTAGILYKELNTRYLAVPVIEYYYGHNGGWFNGQSIGTGAGSRISFKLLIVDLEKADIVLNYEKVVVKIYEYTFNLSVIEIAQDLYKSERKIIKELNRVFPD